MSTGGWSRERLLAITPAFAFVLAIVALPVARVVQLSLHRVDLAEGLILHWAGLDQFVRLWQDARWWMAVRNTLTFTFASVGLELALGLLFAIALHRRFRGRGVARAIVLVPWALPTAIMALAWAWIFNDAFGVANDLLLRLGLIEQPVAWLGRPASAMLALVVADVWKTTPFVALILLAGLQSVPEELAEAARVDGLSTFQRWRHVTLPLLAPAIVVAVVFRTVQAYGAFDLIYVMTGGGPGGATETVSLYAYQSYFRYLDFGYGSAVAVQGVMIVGVLCWALVRLARPRESPR